MSGIQVANAPCSWGVLEFDETAGQGLQGMSPDCDQVLAEIRQAGYAGTELGDWGFMPTEPEALRTVLSEHDLPVLGAFVPVALADERAHQNGLEVALRTARLLAAVQPSAFIVLADDNGSDPTRTRCAGRILPQQGLDDAGWDRFAAGASQIARGVLEATGLRTVFHFHCAGFVETPFEVRTLMDRTDSELLGLCFDTGHYAFGGGNPVQGIEEYGDRVWHVHFKDFDPDVAGRAAEAGWDYFESVGRGVFCELGAGNVDFPTISGQLRSRAYQGWIVVEQDVLPGMGTPLESAVRSRSYLSALGL